MNDFFSVCQTLDFGKLPSASFNGCTLGVTDLKHQYSHFSLKNIYFLPATSRSPGMGGMNVHAFTVAGLGCFVNCTYCILVSPPMRWQSTHRTCNKYSREYVKEIVLYNKFSIIHK